MQIENGLRVIYKEIIYLLLLYIRFEHPISHSVKHGKLFSSLKRITLFTNLSFDECHPHTHRHTRHKTYANFCYIHIFEFHNFYLRRKYRRICFLQLFRNCLHQAYKVHLYLHSLQCIFFLARVYITMFHLLIELYKML